MSLSSKFIQQIAGRALIVLATTLVIGYCFFGSSIFYRTRQPSQFLTSGIAAAQSQINFFVFDITSKFASDF